MSNRAETSGELVKCVEIRFAKGFNFSVGSEMAKEAGASGKGLFLVVGVTYAGDTAKFSRLAPSSGLWASVLVDEQFGRKGDRAFQMDWIHSDDARRRNSSSSIAIKRYE